MAYLSAAHSERTNDEPSRDALGVWVANSDVGELCCLTFACGKGDASHGRYASSYVVRAFEHWFRDDLARMVTERGCLDLDRVALDWEGVIAGAHAHLLTKAACSGGAGCATSVATCFVHEDDCLVVQVGDTHLFALDDAGARELTRDESYVDGLVASGELGEDEARRHPARTVTSQAVGASTHLCPVFERFERGGADLFVGASDGLVRLSGAEGIAAAFVGRRRGDDDDLSRACRALVDACGTGDDVTVCCVASERAAEPTARSA